MGLHELATAIGRRRLLDRAADPIASGIRRVLPPGPVKDALSGRWLGHAAHPMLTDLPIGFWTSASVLDLVGGRRSRPAADLFVALGIATVPAVAATGASDWADTMGPHRRIGLVHASANVAATGFYVASLVARRRGRRGRGVLLGLAGAGAATVGGWLGGHLVASGVGVDNTAFDDPPGGDGPDGSWEDVGPASAVPSDGRPVALPAQGGRTPVFLARREGRLVALDDRCTHRGGPLHEGAIEGGCATCPWHGSRFALPSGAIERGPAATPAPAYQVREVRGRVEVRCPPRGAEPGEVVDVREGVGHAARTVAAPLPTGQ